MTEREEGQAPDVLWVQSHESHHCSQRRIDGGITGGAGHQTEFVFISRPAKRTHENDTTDDIMEYFRSLAFFFFFRDGIIAKTTEGPRKGVEEEGNVNTGGL